jgi:lipopolysaccharide export LptBFGC system permease protein LptF
MFLVVMMMLRIVLDLFTNMDEFTEQSGSLMTVLASIGEYYATQSLVYFIELGGLMIVASAGFTLARMNHTNELTAMLASGVSLHRVVIPIIICSVLMGGLVILDQELLVPRFAHLLIRDHDETGERADKEFVVSIMTDSNNTAWFSKKYTNKDKTIHRPMVTLRDKDAVAIGMVATEPIPTAPAPTDPDSKDLPSAARYGNFANTVGWHIRDAQLVKINRTIDGVWPTSPTTKRVGTNLNPVTLAKKIASKPSKQPKLQINRISDLNCGLVISAAKFETNTNKPTASRPGYLHQPRFVFRNQAGQLLGTIYASNATWIYSDDIPSLTGYWKLKEGVLFLPSDLTPEALVLRQSAEWISYMSTRELTQLLKLKSIPGGESAVLTLHARIANPVNNLVMLLLGLPFILSRQRNIKKSVGLNILVVGLFYVFIYGCRYMSIEPVWAAWLPVLIFGPLAAVMFDTVKT